MEEMMMMTMMMAPSTRTGLSYLEDIHLHMNHIQSPSLKGLLFVCKVSPPSDGRIIAPYEWYPKPIFKGLIVCCKVSPPNNRRIIAIIAPYEFL